MKPSAVIFDMDGVIVDSEPLNDRHFKQFVGRLGVPASWEPDRSLLGMNSKTLWTWMKEEHGLEGEVDELIREARVSYLSFLNELSEIPIIPGVRELLDRVSADGYRLALASSANPRRIELFLHKLDLDGYFEQIVSGDDVVHGKPHPEVFLLAAHKLGVHPGECVVIEDSEAGVRAAKAAGMYCIGYHGSTPSGEDLSNADRVVLDFGALASSPNLVGP